MPFFLAGLAEATLDFAVLTVEVVPVPGLGFAEEGADALTFLEPDGADTTRPLPVFAAGLDGCSGANSAAKSSSLDSALIKR